MPTQRSPVQRVLPCHRSPWTSPVLPWGIGIWLTRSVAASNSGEDPLARRSAAKSTSASGRMRSGRLGRGAAATAWRVAAAAPSARSRALHALAGIVLLPARAVISRAGRPAPPPSRSTASSRGAASWYSSAKASAAASVASRWRLLGSPTRRTVCSTVPPRSMPSRQGPPPARSPSKVTTLAPAPTWLAAQRSTGSIDIDRHSVGAI